MKNLPILKKDPILLVIVICLLVVSTVMLNSVAAYLFPQYFLFILLAFVLFIITANLDFDIYMVFPKVGFIVSLLLLILPIIIGEATRGVVRWIPIGSFSLQPAEVVRPFLLLFFAGYLTTQYETVSSKKLIKAFILFLVPFFLIFFQPSFGVAMITLVGFVGVLLAINFRKIQLLVVPLIGLLASPVVWLLLAPYQKQRILSVFSSSSDSMGANYNSLQSMISVGSGQLTGRGLGSGIQTQLSFLPERHTDFIFAAVSEELGLLGSLFLILLIFGMLYRVITTIQFPQNLAARAFVSGVFLTLLAQITVHIGMNMGLLPITGLPLPLVSAGGSSLLGTAIMLGMVVSAKK